MYAQAARGAACFYAGEPTIARIHLEQSMALYDQHRHRFVGAADAAGPACRCWLAICLCYLGYLDQARLRAHEALMLAQGQRHPYSIVLALDAATVVSLNRGELPAALKGAEAIITLAQEQEFPYWLARGTMWKGLALIAQGQQGEGFAQVHQGYSALLTVGSAIHKTFQGVPMAQAYGAAGQPQEGLRLLTEALAFIEKTGARCCEAEIYRGKGELMLAGVGGWGLGVGKKESPASSVRRIGSENTNPRLPTPNPKAEGEAEACFFKAIDIARRQHAKALELQAVMSLGRLWARQGKKKETRQLLAGIYEWFTEGFETGDLQEAKSLLEELP
jgi:predicted ATPase